MTQELREIGGFIELDTNNGGYFHNEAVRINTARNALRLLIRARNIKRMLLPYYLCDSVTDGCHTEGVQVSYYEIDKEFKPVNISLESDQWLY